MSIATLAGKSSRDKFVEELNVLINAGVGVTAIRTREPFIASNIVKTMAYAEERTIYKMWTMTSGWSSFDRANPTADPDMDGTVQVAPALMKIMGSASIDAFPDNGYYVMMWPHFPLKNSAVPPILQQLAELSYLLPETLKRLILLVPPEFDVPKELEDAITIMDHDTPTLGELREGYDRILVNIAEGRRPSYADEDVMLILNAGMGMTSSEFETALTRAIVENRGSLPDVPIGELSKSVSLLKTEVIKRSEVLELMEVGTMAEVGGLDVLKSYMAARKYAFSAEAFEMGVDRPKGIALIGPPGTGKSLAAKATAHELGLPLIKFDVSRVFAGLVGASEGRVRAALKLVDALSPCVVLLDEVDKAFNMNSGGGDSGVGMRVLGAILTHMQESTKPVYWVMTANRTQGLPPELLRKGRLDEVFAVTLPVADERRDIFNIHLSKRGWAPQDVEGLEAAVSETNGFVPAEIEAIVKEAITVHYSTWKASGSTTVIPPLTGAMLVEQKGNMKPLSEAFAEQFLQMEEWANNNARSASTQKSAAKTRERVRTSPVANLSSRPRARQIGTAELDS